jgi:2-keto-4-pentenoate hydratase/2-oxohepta-3-ene-1,7-dioic acid hydratase in catechol pathway
VTADSGPDPHDLRIWTKVNDEVLQDDTTKAMVFDIAALLAHLSNGTTLEPGDVILTGTPSGAGAFAQPPRYLADGDLVEVGVDGIGLLRNKVQYR